MFICLKGYFISMMVMCYASDITEYDRRTSELSSTLLNMKQDANSIEQYTSKT